MVPPSVGAGLCEACLFSSANTQSIPRPPPHPPAEEKVLVTRAVSPRDPGRARGSSPIWATSILSKLSSADLLLPSSLASCIIHPVIKAAGTVCLCLVSVLTMWRGLQFQILMFSCSGLVGGTPGTGSRLDCCHIFQPKGFHPSSSWTQSV